MSTHTPKIALRDVHKRFGNRVVLDGINLSIPRGESLVIIGGSGTGKSVLLKSILGLIQPDTGDILIDGINTTRLNLKEREQMMHQFGMLFQGGALFDSLQVWENITFAVRQQTRMKRADAIALAVEKLKAVGLVPEVAMQFPSELSGGMQKRVSLARAITGDPEIIFFDEPTTGLDPIMADVINELIVECTRGKGLTTVTITHDMASARKIATQIAMIYQGTIIWEGSPDNVDHSDNPFVDQFVHGRAHGPITDGAKAA
jgi:phospholipid/cholesterol/gamma-HCH transport system ATP-binding protein